MNFTPLNTTSITTGKNIIDMELLSKCQSYVTELNTKVFMNEYAIGIFVIGLCTILMFLITSDKVWDKLTIPDKYRSKMLEWGLTIQLFTLTGMAVYMAIMY